MDLKHIISAIRDCTVLGTIIWMDYLLNLRQYILQYPVTNPKALHNVPFHWLTNEYMQLASGFMQLAAAERRCNKVRFHHLFEGKLLIVHMYGDNHIQNFHLGRYIVA